MSLTVIFSKMTTSLQCTKAATRLVRMGPHSNPLTRNKTIMRSLAKSRNLYRAQLRRCGFTSWRKANARRCELIRSDVENKATDDERTELAALQLLADYRIDIFPPHRKATTAIAAVVRRLKRSGKWVEPKH